MGWKLRTHDVLGSGVAVNIPLMQRQRYELRLRQRDIAEALGVDRSTVAGWETGKSEPLARQILALAKLLNTTADDLLADPEPQTEAVAG
jgi:transcriptional regulator with XRE-family HTH domain